MIEGGQKNLYVLCEQPWAKVQGALAMLVKEKSRLESLNLPTLEKMFVQISALSARVNATNANEPLLVVDRNIVRLLEVAMVEEFLKEPTDQIIRDNLSIELLYLSATIGALPGITPYTVEEFKMVLQGEGSIYNDQIFLSTLRSAATTDNIEYAKLLIGTLPPAKADIDSEDVFWWDGGLVLAASLQMIWHFFPAFDLAEQEALLQHYFYRGLVVGVPVRSYLEKAFSNAADGDALAALHKLCIDSLMTNEEVVPLNRTVEEWKKLGDVYREYLPKVYNEDIGILAQEKFIKNLYQGTVVQESYFSWLREALNIFFHLKREDLI